MLHILVETEGKNMAKTLVIKLVGKAEDIDQAFADLKSNIEYDRLDVKVSLPIPPKPRKA